MKRFRPFVFETLPSNNGIHQIDVDRIIKTSRKKYTTPVKQVEEEIISWRKNYECMDSLRQGLENAIDEEMNTVFGDNPKMN